MSPWDHYEEFPRHQSVGDRRAKAELLAKKLAKKGHLLEPAVVKGTKLATSFWGQAWNRNLERYQHYENRLPRGRSYVKNGSVIDLKVEKGGIKALVSGTRLYEVSIYIHPIKAERWRALKKQCSGQIHSLVGLLKGQIPPSVMEAVTQESTGLFPEPRDIRFLCNCPDDADLCKHSSAAAYGVGARLDESPELLFLLRGVDHLELIDSAGEAAFEQAGSGGGEKSLDDLSGIFGIDLEESAVEIEMPKSKKVVKKKRAKKKIAQKKAVKKTSSRKKN